MYAAGSSLECVLNQNSAYAQQAHYLKCKAVISGCLVLAPVVLSIINIYMFQLQKADQVFRCLEEKQLKYAVMVEYDMLNVQTMCIWQK